MVFATVANRAPENLSKGLLDIPLISFEDLKYFQTCQEMLMVESKTYFEPQRHVLEGIKLFTATTVPMERYLVYCPTDVNTAVYLKSGSSSKYELRSSLNIPEGFPSNINILNKREWPKHKETKLNNSQLNAFKHALTNEFVITQGPPGTGKTHVRLKITQALLENKRSKEPLLVVCQKNHTLDQFLNGLIALGHNNLIRVGGKCSEELKHYSIQNKAQRILESTELKSGDVQNCGVLKLLQKKIKRIRRAKYKAHPGQSTYRKRIDNLFEKVRMTEETL